MDCSKLPCAVVLEPPWEGYMEKQQMLYHKDVAQWCFAGDVEPRTQQHKSTYGFKSIKLLM